MSVSHELLGSDPVWIVSMEQERRVDLFPMPLERCMDFEALCRDCVGSRW